MNWGPLTLAVSALPPELWPPGDSQPSLISLCMCHLYMHVYMYVHSVCTCTCIYVNSWTYMYSIHTLPEPQKALQPPQMLEVHPVVNPQCFTAVLWERCVHMYVCTYMYILYTMSLAKNSLSTYFMQHAVYHMRDHMTSCDVM